MHARILYSRIRLAALLITSFTALFSVSLAACKKEVRSEKAIVVAALFPLSGPSAQYGKYFREGVELALEDAYAGGTLPRGSIELVIEDSTLEPSKAVSAFQQLNLTKKPAAVLAATSGVILALKPLVEQSKIVLLNASAISPEIENADDFCFSVIPNAETEGRFIADFAYSKNYQKLAVLYRNDASGGAFKQTFAARINDLGSEIVFEQAHLPNEADYRPYITRLRAVQGLDALFVASFGPEAALFLKQARENGLSIPVLSYTTFYQPKVLEIAGPAAEAVVFSAPAFDPLGDSSEAVALRRKVAERFGQSDINSYIASHYDAMFLVLEGIKSGARDGESLRQYLGKLQHFSGMSGAITFLANGASSIPLKMYTVSGGRFAAL